MQNDTSDRFEGSPESGSPAAVPPGAVPPAPPAEPPRRSGKAMWVGMGAVLLALVLFTMMPRQEPVNPNAPPPAADGAVADIPTEDEAFIGKPAPLDFTLKDTNNVDVHLASFKGKVILLNFWATWCGPCKEEIPGLVELQAQYADDLVVLGLSVDDTIEKMLPYAKEYQINYPLLVGKGHENVQDAYGPLWGIPVSVIIDRDGTIHWRHSAIASKEQFEEQIRAALAPHDTHEIHAHEEAAGL